MIIKIILLGVIITFAGYQLVSLFSLIKSRLQARRDKKNQPDASCSAQDGEVRKE